MRKEKCKICGHPLIPWYKHLFDDRHGYVGYFDIIKCDHCGFAQTFPQIKKSNISKLYEKYYPRKNIDVTKVNLKDFKYPGKYTLWKKGALNGCQFWTKPGSLVLDVGAGLGHSLLWLKNMGSVGYGIDPDSNAIQLARKFKLNFYIGFIEDKPFGGKKFDYVIANQVIEHTNDPIAFVKDCKSRLKPRGEIIFSFPNVNSLTRVIFARKWLHWHVPYHLNHFTKKSIVELSKKTDLKIKKIVTVTPNMWTTLQIMRIVNNPSMGKRDILWDPQTEKGRVNKEGSVVFITKVMKWIEKNNYINRLIDAFGIGECFVVILKQK